MVGVGGGDRIAVVVMSGTYSIDDLGLSLLIL